MKRERTERNLKGAILGLILTVGFLNLFGCAAKDDVSFARNVMAGLVAGRYSVRGSIDWASLKVMDKDVSAEYNKLPNDQEKTDYQRSFIDNFKKGFRSQHATFKSFNQWRLFSDKDPNIKVVAAGCPDKTKVFLFSIRHAHSAMRLIAIGVLQITDEAVFKAFEKGRAL